MMKRIIFFSGLLLGCLPLLRAQSVGIGTTTPKPSAQLDVNSSNKGMLIPRMSTSQRNAISNPEFGLMVFDTDKSTVMFYDGTIWKGLSFTSEDQLPPILKSPPGGIPYGNFGSKVAISGNNAIIGAARFGSPGFSSMGEAYIYSKSANGWQPQARLAAKDSATQDYFGGSVAISRDYAVVGSVGKTVGSNNSQGRVYVYKRSGSNWLLDTSLTKPTGAVGDFFGWSVGISVTSGGVPLLAVGIPFSDATGTNKGEVYIYTLNTFTNKWTFLQSIVATDLGMNDNFGYSISIDGDYMSVGAPFQDNATYNYINAGAAYIYVFGGGVFTLQQKLQGFTAYSNFGLSSSLHRDRLAVSAPGASPFTNTSAAVNVYKRNGASWSSISNLYLADFEGGSLAITFGMSLALSGNSLLIGASGGADYPNGGSSVSYTVSGTVHVYKTFDGNTYSRQLSIKSESPLAADLFGGSVGFSGNNYIISAPRSNSNNIIQSGAVIFGFLIP